LKLFIDAGVLPAGGLFPVARDVSFQLFLVRIVRLLLEKAGILGGGFLFESGAVIERSQAQMRLRLANWIQPQRFVEIPDCF
jgi:hypothetical protein